MKRALLAVGLSVLTIFPAPHASADVAAPQCVSLPFQTQGATLTVAGRPVRIPALSDPTVCVDPGDSTFTPLSVDVHDPSVCGTPCLDVYGPRGTLDTDGVGVTITIYADGAPITVPLVISGDIAGFRGICVFSVGRPAQGPDSCLVRLDLD